MKFLICVDKKSYSKKPTGMATKGISERLPNHEVLLTMRDLKNKVEWGYSWCPATFQSGKKKQADFKSQQVFALDFDGDLTLDEALTRAKKHEINVAMSYETFSSENYSRFRLVFLYAEPVNHFRLAKMIQLALSEIFPEADKSGKDPTKLYYGGHNAILYEEEPFSMMPLIIGLTNCLKEINGEKHFTRTLQKFCSNCYLEMKNNRIRIDCSESNNGALSLLLSDKTGELLSYTFIYTMKVYSKSPIWGTIHFIPIKNNVTVHNNSINSVNSERVELKATKSTKLTKKIQNETMETKCRLYREFSQGIRFLEHNERMLIGTNLIQMKGGKTRFLEILNRFPAFYSDKIDKMQIHIDYAIRNSYKPFGCDGFCPYHNECTHDKNMIMTVCTVRPSLMIRLKDYNPQYSNLEDAVQDFKNQFQFAMESLFCGMTVIKAQTGIGKTYTYLEYLKFSKQLCMIAVPTNKLKDEVYTKAKAMEIPIVRTPSVEKLKTIPNLWEIIARMYQQGADSQVSSFLRYWNKQNQNAVVTAYLEESENIFDGANHIITTHARLIHMKEKRLQKYKVIIDEDIFKTAIQIKQIPINEIIKLQVLFEQNSVLGDRIQMILKPLKDGKTYFTVPKNVFALTLGSEFWKVLHKAHITFEWDLSALLTSSVFYCDKRSNTLYAVKVQKPPMQANCTMLSATVNRQVCESFYSTRSLRFVECQEAQCIGKMFQFHDHTYSRYNMRKNANLIKTVKSTYGNTPIISFMEYDDENQKIHLGATDGIDCLSGKDIVIVGTPHKPEFVYKLIGLYLGYSIEMQLSSHEIERNGFRLNFYTYPKSQLQELQLWMIECELEQAVGRARLLRHQCTVYLYSNYPMKQATLSEENIDEKEKGNKT